MAHFSGLIAGKVFRGEFDPVPFSQIITSTTHKTLRGPRGGFILCNKEYADVVDKGCPLVLGGPLPHVLAAKAVAFKEANNPEFEKYSHSIVKNAQEMAARFLEKGVRLVTGGTENHMVLLDLTQFHLTGRHAENALREANLTVNRNAIPFDTNGPWYTSGIRIGTPATTTLGMGAKEMHEIADIIIDILKHTKPAISKTGQPSKAISETEPAALQRAKQQVTAILSQFPLYPEIMIEE
jgi:glycine hydroxymethyltransferase